VKDLGVRDLNYKQAFLATTVVSQSSRNGAAINIREDEITPQELVAEMTEEERKVSCGVFCGLFLLGFFASASPPMLYLFFLTSHQRTDGDSDEGRPQSVHQADAKRGACRLWSR
jgi:hypothetical protein